MNTEDQVQQSIEILRQRAQEDNESEYKERAQRFLAYWTEDMERKAGTVERG